MASVTDSAEGKVGAQDKADLTELRRWVDSFTTATQVGRLDSALCIDYYDGKQLSAAVRQALRKRKQPDIVINRVKVAVNGILGVTQRGKSDPKAYPRTPNDEASADVATDALRYAKDKARFDSTKLSVFRDILITGSGAALVGVDGDKNVTIEQIRWEEFIYDPRARREDFADASWLGIAKWMFVDDAKLMWPEKATELESATSAWSGTGAPDLMMRDRPLTMGWVDPKQRRLMVVECYYRRGGRWVRSVFARDVELEHGESPYQDEHKRPICPIEAQSAYVDQENQRYGAVRDMRGPQDEINARRSKGLHWLNVRQIQEVSPGSGRGNIEDARKEAARPDGVLPSGWQVVPGSAQQVQGNLEMLQEAKNEIERLSPNPAILGRDGEDQSGKALLARQQAGLVELALLYGGLEDWELRIYRQVWARMKQFWTAPMWVRVTDDVGSPQFVGLNQPRGEPMVHPPVGPDGQPHPMAGQPVVDPSTGQQQEAAPQFHGPVAQDPFSDQPVANPLHGQPVLGYKNQVAEMDVDIILDTTPDTANIQAEQYQDMLQLVGSSPIYQQQVPLSSLIKLSSMTNKKQVLDDLEQNAQAGQQQQQQQQQFAQQQHEADLAETASKIELNKANAAKSQVEAETKSAGGLLDALQAGMADAQHEPHQHNASSPTQQAETEAALAGQEA